MSKPEAPKGYHAWTVKMGERGQIVIPKEAREIFNLHPGDTLILLGDEARGIAIDTTVDFAAMSRQIFGNPDGPEKDDDTSDKT